jgi:hypothetical protein
MEKERIKKAIEIINYAIKNRISVKEASVKCGYSNTYVKNVKAAVYRNHIKGDINDDQFTIFNEEYLKYKNIFTQESHVTEKIINKKPNDLPTLTSGDNLSLKTNGIETEVEWSSGSNYPKNHVKTLDELLQATKADLNLWKVDSYTVNKWDTTCWKKGIPETIQNWQVKARLIRDAKVFKENHIGEMFINMISDYKPPVFDWQKKTSSKIKEHNLLEISIFDLHIGKLAWGGETFENYDTKIARQRFLYSIESLLHRARGFEYSRILFPIGSDFFNSDTIYNTTTKGTQQDEDLRWQKTFDVGTRLLIDGINMLKQTGVPVDVIVIPGNHDYERSFYMGKFISAWFNNDSQVSVDTHASPRKYYRFGNVLLGLTHGSEERESSLPMIMATDIVSKPQWSGTKFHEWHVGHQHRKKNVKYDVIDNKERSLNEDLGVTIRYLSSLTGTDGWHHKLGFIGQIKAADAFIWNYEYGFIAHLNSNIIIE